MSAIKLLDEKYSAFYFSEIMIICAHPASMKRAFRPIVTTREAGSGGRRKRERRSRRSRTAKSWGPGVPVLALMRDDASHQAQTGANKPVHGETSYKP